MSNEQIDVVFTEDASSGMIHRRLATDEDRDTDEFEITRDRALAKAPEFRCRRCFPGGHATVPTGHDRERWS